MSSFGHGHGEDGGIHARRASGACAFSLGILRSDQCPSFGCRSQLHNQQLYHFSRFHTRPARPVFCFVFCLGCADPIKMAGYNGVNMFCKISSQKLKVDETRHTCASTFPSFSMVLLGSSGSFLAAGQMHISPHYRQLLWRGSTGVTYFVLGRRRGHRSA